MNRQIAYADSTRVASNAVVSDVNVVVASGEVAARQGAQRDVLTACGNIDSRSATQRNIEVAGSTQARYSTECGVSEPADVAIQRTITGSHIANACRVGKKSQVSTSHIVRALCIIKKGLHTDGDICAARRILVERSVSKRRVPYPGGVILQRASSIGRVTAGKRGFRRLYLSQSFFEVRSTGRVGGRSCWHSQEKGQRY
jgi:hypothetical protein